MKEFSKLGYLIKRLLTDKSKFETIMKAASLAILILVIPFLHCLQYRKANKTAPFPNPENNEPILGIVTKPDAD